ncbi:hypothetical protein DFR72_103317 [Lentzea flaviverrucosa]|uniref:Secreted protein n=1 Tax=Lentzea flaviverrucosa TaxID=200379 RepID=A0A1H9B163_9PSEU|nr:hypothetical protein DFR72_103317 [Lentzea flaviverrucosa]SEP82477.1 hypothetical protein SAMN05216195_101341 [Lentzea flaviverrucosa]
MIYRWLTGSGHRRGVRFVSVAAVAAFVLAGSSSGVAHAESAPGCGPVTQIGSTAYIQTGTSSSSIVASVKQFKGCGKNWSYVWVWDSWISKGRAFEVGTAIYPDGANPAGYVKTRNKQATWSKGTDTLSKCTRASGTFVDLVNDPSYGWQEFTDKRC